jgi:hypothetical protein
MRLYTVPIIYYLSIENFEFQDRDRDRAVDYELYANGRMDVF